MKLPVDASVFSPERLDFVGPPIIQGQGLEYTEPKPIYYEGTYLDTYKMKGLSPQEKKEFKLLVTEAKKKMEPLAAQKAAEWKSNKIAAMKASGTPADKAKELVEEMLKNGVKHLPSEFVLEFTSGCVTVAEVLKNPKNYEGTALADPIEGSAYGKTTAKFWYNDGKPMISSLAHGKQTTFCLLSKDWKQDFEDFVQVMNADYANVITGVKNRILRIEPNHTGSDNHEKYSFFERGDLKKVYDNQKIKVGEKEEKGKIVDIFQNPILAWVSHPKCRTFPNGVIFLPGQKVSRGVFNTWQGFAVKPQKNKKILDRLLYHIREVVCRGDAELYRYVIRWMAYTFQYPERPIGTALVLRGKKGCGKGTLGHMLRKIWGRHALHIASSKFLVGNFNGHLADICFLFADEAFYSGDKKNENILKALITEPTLIIERKGIDAIQQPNYLKILWRQTLTTQYKPVVMSGGFVCLMLHQLILVMRHILIACIKIARMTPCRLHFCILC